MKTYILTPEIVGTFILDTLRLTTNEHTQTDNTFFITMIQEHFHTCESLSILILQLGVILCL